MPTYQTSGKILLAVAILSISAQLTYTLPLAQIPVTGQTLALLVCAALLPLRQTVAFVLLYLLLGAAGLPVFADGASGIEVFTGSSGGYLLGFLLGAAAVSHLHNRAAERYFLHLLALMTLGTAIILLCGGLRLVTLFGLESATEYGFVNLWKGAAVKIFLSAGMVWVVRRVRKKAD